MGYIGRESRSNVGLALTARAEREARNEDVAEEAVKAAKRAEEEYLAKQQKGKGSSSSISPASSTKSTGGLHVPTDQPSERRLADCV